MKKNGIWVLMFGVGLFSCSKDDGDNIPTTASSEFAYKIDGKQIAVKGSNAYGFVFTDGDYGIYGISPDGSDETCYILIAKNTAVGEYDIKSVIKGYYTTKTGETYYTVFAEGGKLQIERKDEVHVKGTFSFVAGDGNTPLKKVHITEGKFNVRLK
jgi:hypothetical protein